MYQSSGFTLRYPVNRHQMNVRFECFTYFIINSERWWPEITPSMDESTISVSLNVPIILSGSARQAKELK